MSLFNLPAELVEKVIQCLEADTSALANCSLACRHLLARCRPHLWKTVYLSYDLRSLPTLRTVRFLDLLEDDADIGPHVRSLAIHHGVLILNPESGNLDSTFGGLFPNFPMLETLSLDLLCTDGTYRVLAMARTIPTLRRLVLIDTVLSTINTAWPSDASLTNVQVCPGSKPWALRALSILTIVPTTASELLALTAFLERSKDVLCLESFEILRSRRPYLHSSEALSRALVPSFGSSLRHFGFTIKDMAYNGSVSLEDREHIKELYAALPHCRTLRSLSIQYDGNGVCSGPTSTGWAPPPIFPFFLEKLADLLSGASGSPVPFPDLERLSILFRARVDRVLNCGEAFGRLAAALVGSDGPRYVEGARASWRYPAFSELRVQAMPAVVRPATSGDDDNVVYDAQRAQYEQTTDGRVLLRPMFAPFLKAGVRVDIQMDDD